MILRFTLGFLSLVLSFTASAYPNQEVLGSPKSGLLRRFPVREVREIEKLLELAKDHDLDVWHIEPTHIDIYSPPSGPSLPPQLLHFSHSETVFPVRPDEVRVARSDWNLSSLTNTTYHSSYHPLQEIDNFIQDIAALHPALVTVVELGHSGRGKEMLGLTISRSGDNAKKGGRKNKAGKNKGWRGRKLGFVITGAQHAREWVATSSALYLVHALVSDASEPYSLSSLLDFFDFHIIPVPNPDGYDYTWETDRFWYKNRMILGPHAKCVGLDMNRNWGYKWKPHAINTLDTSSCAISSKPAVNPCSHWYPGQHSFEAPEVNNIAYYISTLPDLEAFIDLRSYGQMLSSPYSYTCKKVPKDAEDQLEAALGATFALKSVHGTQFVTGSLCSTLYRAPGNIVDWMYAKGGIKYSYAVHLRDTGTYGFALPPRFIRPVGEEMGKMIEYIAHFIWQKRSVFL